MYMYMYIYTHNMIYASPFPSLFLSSLSRADYAAGLRHRSEQKANNSNVSRTFSVKPRPEHGLDCVIRATFTRVWQAERTKI